MSVSALLGAPAARGSVPSGDRRERAARTRTPLDAGAAGPPTTWPRCSASASVDRAGLESVPAAELVAATQSCRAGPRDRASCRCPSCRSSTAPSCPGSPTRRSPRRHRRCPLLIGTNRDELTFFALGDPDLGRAGRQGLLEDGLRLAAPRARRPPTDRRELPPGARTARGSRSRRRSLGGHRDRPGVPVAVAAGWPRPSGTGPAGDVRLPVHLGVAGLRRRCSASCHALEIPFVFGARPPPGDRRVRRRAAPRPRRCHDRMQRGVAVVRPLRRSDAMTASVRGRAWDADRRATMVFGPSSGWWTVPGTPSWRVWSTRAA